MNSNLIINIVAFSVVGVILFFYLKKEKRKTDKYLGKKVKLTRKEQSILDSYRKNYEPVPDDTRYASIDKDGYELIDVAMEATEVLYDNPLPTKKERSELKEGDHVKLKFMDPEGDVERMWVEVEKVEPGIFKGRLRNDSMDSEALREDKVVWFHPNHVFLIDTGSKT